jgi:hypothetical protein
MKTFKRDDVLSYRDMCDAENVQTLQRGMNFRLNSNYSVVLMSQRPNAPYKDGVAEDGQTIIYEGHDVSKTEGSPHPKSIDQPHTLPSGKLTQNGYFLTAVDKFKNGSAPVELVKVYEKILPGVWSLKGIFDLIGYEEAHDGARNVFRFELKLSLKQEIN